MATEDWPADLAKIEWSGYRIGRAETVRRTTIEDGAVRQARHVTRGREVRQFNALVKFSESLDFMDWIKDHGDAAFNFSYPDNVEREVRIVGGQGAVALESVTGELRLDGERYLRATIEIEEI